MGTKGSNDAVGLFFASPVLQLVLADLKDAVDETANWHHRKY